MSRPGKRRSRRSRRRGRPTWVLPAIAMAAVIVVGGLVWLSNRPSDPTNETVVVPTKVARPPAEGTALGPPDAPVLVEEYSDFQ